MPVVNVVTEDLVASYESIIGHGVNCQGVMGSGIAKQIRARYPEVYDEYLKFCKKEETPKKLLGLYQPVTILNDFRVVLNIFSQEFYGRENIKYMSYDAIHTAFSLIDQDSGIRRLGIPLIGAGLGGGDERAILSIINSVTPNTNIIVYKLPKGS